MLQIVFSDFQGFRIRGGIKMKKRDIQIGDCLKSTQKCVLFLM